MKLQAIPSSTWRYALLSALSLGPGGAIAELQPASTQLTTFNSSFQFSQQQISRANLSAVDAQSLENVLNWDRSQYAGGPTTEDEFYTLPSLANGSYLVPGTLLKTEDFTNITNYSLSANLALSRILYVSKNLNGTAVPASAFILWPFSPRQFPSIPSTQAPTVIWNHMTSGWFGPAAPSKHRALFAGDNAPFALGLAGYAVVAPDYAGLGVSVDFEGKRIAHQYLASPASANDGAYAYKAAKAAFPDRLSDKFAVLGQSQGGGVSWGTAELMFREPSLAQGYLGAVAVSPTTDAFSAGPNFIGPFIGFGLSSVFPNFKLSDWLTPFGVGRAKVFEEVEGGLATALETFGTTKQITQDNYSTSWEAESYAKLINPGSKQIAGPLLVIQGTADVFVSFNVTSKTVVDTCAKYPQNAIQYLISNGTGHVPSLDASRHIWMSWLEDRFAGVDLPATQCGNITYLESYLPIERYQATTNAFLQWAGAPEYSYQVPLAL